MHTGHKSATKNLPIAQWVWAVQILNKKRACWKVGYLFKKKKIIATVMQNGN